MLRKIYGTNFFHIKFQVAVASNVKMDQCCPQLRFFILMVRFYIHTYHARLIPEDLAKASQILL
jgi:hypothetical protein